MTHSEKNKMFISSLTGGLLWNFNKDILDYKRDKRLFIERIIESGLENDEYIMWNTYSYNDIKNAALNIHYLSEKKLNYISFVLNINKEKFKCFGKKPWYQK